MDISEHPNNSIAEIERFITSVYPDTIGIPTSLTVKSFFPRVRTLIQEVKDRLTCPKRKKSTELLHTTRKKQRQAAAVVGESSPKSSSNSIITVDSVSKQVNASILDWVQKQPSNVIGAIKDSFSIQVKPSTSQQQSFTVVITCIACNVKVHLSCSDLGSYKISSCLQVMSVIVQKYFSLDWFTQVNHT